MGERGTGAAMREAALPGVVPEHAAAYNPTVSERERPKTGAQMAGGGGYLGGVIFGTPIMFVVIVGLAWAMLALIDSLAGFVGHTPFSMSGTEILLSAIFLTTMLKEAIKSHDQ
jgi:hypothetical protein